MKFFGLAVLAIAISSAPSALAEGWDIQVTKMEMDRKVSAKGDYEYESLQVWTADTSQPKLLLSCSERFGLTATVNFVPEDHQDAANARQNVSIKLKRADLIVEGRKKENPVWSYVPKLRALQSRDSKTPAMIYNAIVQGRTVTIEEPFHRRVTLPIPDHRDEAFVRFRTLCPITKG